MAVQARRAKLGIPASPKWRLWTAEEDALLGTLTDSGLGVRLGCKTVVVADRRRKLGIAPFTLQPEYRPWTAEEEALLGTMVDEKLAPQINRTVKAVIGHRCELGIPAAPRLRQSAVGVRLGCKTVVVAARRRKLGIAPLTPT